jgi:hypothetical protein
MSKAKLHRDYEKQIEGLLCMNKNRSTQLST